MRCANRSWVQPILFPWLVVALLPACKAADVTPSTPASDTASAADAGDAAGGLNTADGVDAAPSPDSSPSDAASPDAAGCPGAPGCPCATAAECDNVTCLDTPEGKRCAQSCVDTCAAGYACTKLGASDTRRYCVSQSLALCAPCSRDADCRPHGSGALCLDYGDAGHFCGAVCDTDGDCAQGYACVEAAGAGGETAKQCRLKSGACACSAWAAAQNAATICRVSNADGACSALRRCTAEGLQACTADTPAPELCNTLDDDCDGVVDNLPPEATCVTRAFEGGGSKAACTTDEDCKSEGEACDEAGACRPLIGACPGTPTCTAEGKLVCESAKVPQVETCNLRDDDCDGQTDEGFVATLAGGATAVMGQACGLGVCAGGTVVCADSGAAACSTAGKASKADPCDGLDNDCDGQTDEGACDDGDACTKDLCDPVAGLCSHSPAADCDDGQVCTADGCDKGTGECLHAAGAGLCDDGNACTVGDACKEGTCLPGEATVCDDGRACTVDTCDADKGCVALAVPDGPGCEDGDACTAGDACKAGRCAPGTTRDCDDGNACTADACDSAKGCGHTAREGLCDDGNTCTAGDACKEGLCLPGEATVCDDGNTCTVDTCEAKKGCIALAVPDGLGCEEGDVCTAGDACKAGQCVPGPKPGCDDGEPCTDDSCDPITGCTRIPNHAICDDGNQCTKADNCSGGKCIGSMPPSCDDGNVCTVDICRPASGCANLAVAAGMGCEDGDGCTVGDACKEGKCVLGPKPKCDDGNPCTDDTCVVGPGCMHTTNAAACNDRSKCTTVDACKQGKCVGNKPPVCDDGNVCTVDLCAAALGCVHQAEHPGVSCDDGNACTQGDSCAGPTCKGGKAKACADEGRPCTVYACNPGTGNCDAKPVPDGTTCVSGQGQCDAGACLWADPAGRKWGLVPAGTFWMGCNSALDKSCLNNEKPQHKVTITKPFWLEIYEVTESEFSDCIRGGVCARPVYAKDCNWRQPGKEKLPINCVTRDQAQVFCLWAGGRLPTEAEWELAARGRCEENGGVSGCKSKMRIYPWGNASPVCGKHAVFFTSSGKGCGEDRMWSVGKGSSAGRGPYGQYDLVGNAWEWVQDRYSASYYASSPGKDPLNTAGSAGHSIRGAGYHTYGSFARAGLRFSDKFWSDYVGFRCLRPFP